jgi:hypothetical protein
MFYSVTSITVKAVLFYYVGTSCSLLFPCSSVLFCWVLSAFVLLCYNVLSYSRGPQIPGTMLPGQLNLLRWRLIFVGPWNLLHIILLTPNTVRWLLYFWKICASISYSTVFYFLLFNFCLSFPIILYLFHYFVLVFFISFVVLLFCRVLSDYFSFSSIIYVQLTWEINNNNNI